VAQRDVPGGLAHVEKVVLGSPAFDRGNIMHVRSLVNGFRFSHTNLHAPDGSGYKFTADWVLRTDTVNPVWAARFCKGLGDWQRYEPVRRGMMRAQLERVRAGATSPDVLEVAEKALAGA